MADEPRLFLNGVDATTGAYAVPPLRRAEAYAYALGAPVDPARQRQLAYLAQVAQGTYGFEGDLAEIAEVGWGVVVRADEPEAVQREVRRLYAHRARQVPAELLHWLSFPSGGPKQDYLRWLEGLGVGGGTQDATIVPYYLLVIGGPERIPFAFTQGLRADYAVGRLDFSGPDGATDSAALGAYVDAVIAYEAPERGPAAARRLAFFAPRHEVNPLDATHASVRSLVRPLAGLPPEDGGPAPRGVAQAAGWGEPLTALAAEATKERLLTLLRPGGGSAPPALLFTASHGLVYPSGHAEQRAGQGALLCQDWSGAGSSQPAHYLSAADVERELGAARLDGVIPFLFACFSGGTPARDTFLQVEGQPQELAATPFSAALPRALLGRGALACIAHVDRAWASSFYRRGGATTLNPFSKALGRLMRGKPVGYAMGEFSDVLKALSHYLAGARSRVLNGAPGPDDDEETLTWRWVERNDADGYAIFGDPAVRLRPAAMAG